MSSVVDVAKPHKAAKKRRRQLISSGSDDAAAAPPSQRHPLSVPASPRSPSGTARRTAFSASAVSPWSGRLPTVTIALPGSIISNAQSAELRSYLAGQIARAATVFCVDRVVVFRDSGGGLGGGDGGGGSLLAGEFRGAHRQSDPAVFLCRLLQYLDCPQYLRRFLFPVHADLRYAGLLNPLDAPHHLRADESCRWREGVVVNRQQAARGRGGDRAGDREGGGEAAAGGGSWVNVGLKQEVRIDRSLPPLTRVTVELGETAAAAGAGGGGGRLRGRAVSPRAPLQAGQYWGYEVQLCPSFSSIFTSCPHSPDGRYDLTIGTSDRGRALQEEEVLGSRWRLPRWQNLLLVFGGLRGLEDCAAADEGLQHSSAQQLFHLYINACAQQGSRTIRTEEAVLITLSMLRAAVLSNASAGSGGQSGREEA